MDIRAGRDVHRQELQQGEAQAKPRHLRLGADGRRPAQDQPDPAEEDYQGRGFVLAGG